MIAYTIFNDSYTLSLGASSIFISSQGIAWPSDIAKYKITDPSVMWLNTT